MAEQNLPGIGASLFVKTLSQHREWLIEGQRDLELQDPAMASVLDGDWRSLIRQAKSELAGYQGHLGIHGPFIGFSLIAGFDPLICKAVVQRLNQGLDFAAESGAEYMVIHSPFIGFGASPFSVSALPKDLFNERAFIHGVVEPVLKRAESLNCKLVIENVQDNNTQPLIELVRSFASEYVGLSIDVGHAFINHQHGGPTPDQWIRDAGPLLAHMHIQDSDGQTDRHWAPGDGSINWYAIYEEIAALKRKPRMVLELRNHALVQKGAAYLMARGFVK